MKRRDILEELMSARVLHQVPGTANSDINVFAVPVELNYGQLQRAIEEIQSLRKLRDAIAVPCDTATSHRPDRAGP